MTAAPNRRHAARFALAATLAMALLWPLFVAPTAVQAKSAITVSNNGDLADYNGNDCTCATGPSGSACTLRAAIETANACAGTDLILFAADYTITPGTALPALSDASGGTTIASKGRAIVLNGTSVTTGVGLSLVSNGNAIQGLTIQSFGSHNVSVSGDGNVVGTDGDGASDAQERNVVVLSGDAGVHVSGDGNRVAGNYVGLGADGSTVQANAGGGVEIEVGSGNVVGTNGDGVADAAERNVISGNTGAGVTLSGGSGTRVSGNYIGTDPSGNVAKPNTVGGVLAWNGATGTVIGTNGDGVADAAEGNVISGNGSLGLEIRVPSVVAGNYIGLGADGTTDVGNAASGLMLQYHSGSRIGTDADGVSDALERNVISGNGTRGIEVWTTGLGNVIAGNYVGTDATGLAAVPNAQRGIYVKDATGNRIGGLASAERNVISGNAGGGIVTSGPVSGTQVVGNYIGVGADGATALANTTAGVWLRSGSTGVTVGGTAAGAGNVIARNDGPGIYTDSEATISGITVRGNAIYANAGLGIDLNSGSAGVTANDAGDDDTGPNGLQNFPVLTAALTAADGSSSLISGALDSNAGATCTLDLYTNDACDTGGHGEGQAYLGSTTLATDAAGSAGFSLPLLAGVPVGAFVTATATDSGGSTSEFSACVAVTAAGSDSPAGVTVTGPATGFPAIAYSYSANVAPGGASFPVTITWYASGQDPVTRTLTSATDVQSITWAGTGAKTVAVTVHNSSGSVSGSHAFTARDPASDAAPQAADGNLTVVAGNSVAGTLSATDADGDVLTYTIVANGGRGTVTITDARSGAFTYVATAGTGGSDSFAFRAGDGVADSNVATVSVTIEADTPDEVLTFVPMVVRQ